MVTQDQHVAVYWDFENVHFALLETENGEGGNARNRGMQPRLLQLDPILRYLHSLGQITINRAFANWYRFARYGRDLLEHSIDLVQLFPPGGHAKNGADIRLAIDAMNDIRTHPHVSHVVILAGDSDFIPLAQTIRRTGRTVVGIGVRGSTNEYWEKACDEFRFYETLLGDGEDSLSHRPATSNGNGKIAGVGKLVRRAIIAAQGPAHDKWIAQTEVLGNLTKLVQGFRSKRFGYDNVSMLLRSCSDTVEFKTNNDNSPVRLNLSTAPRATN